MPYREFRVELIRMFARPDLRVAMANEWSVMHQGNEEELMFFMIRCQEVTDRAFADQTMDQKARLAITAFTRGLTERQVALPIMAQSQRA